ncbi:glycosyltransferase family 25 protein [Georgenia muralis]
MTVPDDARTSSTDASSLRVYVVNLARHTDRKQRAALACAEQGLRPDFFTGVDAQDADLPPHRSSLTPGEVGCLLSHRGVMRKIATAEGSQYSLILEDDVVFHDNFRGNLQSALELAKTNGAGFVQLGWLPLTSRPPTIRLWRDRAVTRPLLRKIAHAVHRSTPVEPPALQRLDPTWGTHCYLVTPEFARNILDFTDGRVLGPYDAYLRALARLLPQEMWRARFPLAGQDWSLTSSVDAARTDGPSGHQVDSRGRLYGRPSPHAKA